MPENRYLKMLFPSFDVHVKNYPKSSKCQPAKCHSHFYVHGAADMYFRHLQSPPDKCHAMSTARFMAECEISAAFFSGSSRWKD